MSHAHATLCYTCMAFPLPFRSIRFLWPYEDNVRDLISVMKYRPSQKLCGLLGLEMSRAAARFYNTMDWDALIPIPPSRVSLQERSFHQCTILADALSKGAFSGAVPVWAQVLHHRGYSAPQASLSHEKRITNVRNVFRANESVRGKNVLLVEDVITTGATCAEAAWALKAQGAGAIDIIAAARASSWSEFRSTVHEKITLRYERAALHFSVNSS